MHEAKGDGTAHESLRESGTITTTRKAALRRKVQEAADDNEDTCVFVFALASMCIVCVWADLQPHPHPATRSAGRWPAGATTSRMTRSMSSSRTGC
jgi:hypothetical protein